MCLEHLIAYMLRVILAYFQGSQSFIFRSVLHHYGSTFIGVLFLCCSEARVRGVQLRWWQPRHEGAGHDQWALDHVEVIL